MLLTVERMSMSRARDRPKRHTVATADPLVQVLHATLQNEVESILALGHAVQLDDVRVGEGAQRLNLREHGLVVLAPQFSVLDCHRLVFVCPTDRGEEKSVPLEHLATGAAVDHVPELYFVQGHEEVLDD